MDLLAQATSDSQLLFRGILALVTAIVILVGSVWLLLSMVVGARLSYLITASSFFGILILLSVIWVLTAFGPAGPPTTWFAIAVGSDLSEASYQDETYDVGSFPGGDWKIPAEKDFIADLGGENDTLTEAETARPVLETAISAVVAPEKTGGDHEEAEPAVAETLAQGPVDLEVGAFSVVHIRFQEAEVDGKESVIAMARAVPSTVVRIPALPGDIEEGTVLRYLVDVGDRVEEGQPLMVAATDQGEVQIASGGTGRVIDFGLRTPEETQGIGDKVKKDVPFMTLDLSGQPGQPDPVEVSAVRVRGALRTPAVIYLVVSAILFALHLVLLSRAEKARAPAAQPAA